MHEKYKSKNETYKRFKTLLEPGKHKGTGEAKEDDVIAIAESIDIVKPNNILEIGFRRGASALAWLIFSNANLISCDIAGESDSIFLYKHIFQDRFNYIGASSTQLINFTIFYDKFDLMYIDGDHSYIGCKNDIIVGLNLGVKYMLFHDYLNQSHTDDIKRAISEFPMLTFIKQWSGDCGSGLYKVEFA